MARRKANPIGTAGKVALVALGVGAAYGISKAVEAADTKKKKADKKNGKKNGKVSPLSGVWAENAALGNSPDTVDRVVLPVELSFEPEIRDPETGDILPAGTNIIDNQALMELLVTNLTPSATKKAYQYMQHWVENKGYDLSNPSMRDKAVQLTLSEIAPDVDWTQGLQPYAYGTPQVDVWLGTQMLGEMAHQSYWNQQA